MTPKDEKFYENQKILIDLALEILQKEMPKYQKEYPELFYNKKIPPHISQPLQALKNRIFFKPLFKKIEAELEISHRKAMRLVEKYWFSYVFKNIEKFKILKQKSLSKKVDEELKKEEKQNQLF